MQNKNHTRTVVLLICFTLGASVFLAQGVDRSKPPRTAATKGGFSVRELSSLPAIDRTWTPTGNLYGGTYPAPNKQFTLILDDDPANSGEILRFKIYFEEKGKARVQLNTGPATYAWMSPDSRWIFIDPLEVIDVKTWQRFSILDKVDLDFVVIHAISKDGKRLLFTSQDCPFDCRGQNKKYEVRFP